VSSARVWVTSTRLPALARPQVYHYFEDKESLIRAVIAHRLHAVLATLRGLDSMEGLRSWRDLVVDTYRQRNCEGGCALGSLVGELAEPYPECWADLAGGFDQWEAAIREGLQAMCDRGDLCRKANPDRLATPPLLQRRSMRSSSASRTSDPDPRRPIPGGSSYTGGHGRTNRGRCQRLSWDQ
jgi:AcrR family transcriptional regulator